MDNSIYMHNALAQESDIRIVSVHPSHDPQSPLEGTLSIRKCDVYGGSAYEALSYVWGAPSNSHFILIAGKKLFITANCDAALRQFRLPKRPRTLWVDAICINQTQTPEGLLERSSQVAQMGKVYNEAKNVLIWLGTGNCKSEGFFKYVKRTTLVDGDNVASRLWRKYLSSQLEKSTGKHGVDVMDCVMEVLGRGWFERMWCLQEVLLSDNAVVACGAMLLDWKRLVAFKECFSSTNEQWNDLGPYIQCCDTWTLYKKDKKLLQMPDKNEGKKTGHVRDPKQKILMMAAFDVTPKEVAHFLQSARIRKAGDPRDKVFALFSVIHSVHSMFKARRTFPKPDYTKSVAEVYTAATISCLESDTYATVLEYVYSRTRSRALPSWVPDWEDRESQQLKSQEIQLQLGLGSGTKFRTEELGANHVLYLDGRQVGKVIRSSQATTGEELASGGNDNGSSVTASRIATIKTFRRWVDLLDLDDDSTASRFRVSKLGELLTNVVGVEMKNKKHDVRCYFSWIRLFRIANNPSEQAGLASVFDVNWTSPPNDVVNYLLAKLLYAPSMEALRGLDFIEEAWEFHQKVWSLARDWTVFITDRLIEDTGIGLGNIAIGDVIVGLTGCRQLAVLRPQGSRYVMVSPAAVFGITMTGGRGGRDESFSEFAIV